MLRVANSNDRAQILTLIQSRHAAPQAAMEVESQELTIKLGGDFAFSDGWVRLAGIGKGSDGPALFWMRETMCFERDADGWRVVHAEASAPSPFDHGARLASTPSRKLKVDWAPGDPALRPCR
jgi:ketosteroid isomerase-like protein